MKKFLLTYVIILVTLTTIFIYLTHKYTKPKLVIDLPEEIHLTKTGDTLNCIRRNDSLIIEFKP